MPGGDEVFRAESGRVIGALMRRFGDLDLAEDAYQDACLAAVETWPRDGVPTSPGAWLTTVAGNRALDRLRREAGRLPREVAALGLRPDDPVGPVSPPADEELDLDFGPAALADDQLRLLFLCCHPALAEDAQVALTLRTVGGLTTAEIARAFLVPEPTMAQRLVRAKHKISVAGIPFRMPPSEELPERLAAVLRVVYLVFNEGYAATTTDTVVRTDLCDEALRLADLLAQLCPDDAEVLGLRALLVLHDARRPGRVSADGRLVPLAEQDRSRWDHRRIERGTTLVEEALQTGPVGPYQLEAAIAALHAEARTYEETDWSQIVALYDQLVRLDPSPIVALNRAVAVAELDGPEVALAAVDRLEDTLAGYHAFHVTRADLLRRLGCSQQSRAAYDKAIELAGNTAETAYLTRRRDQLG